MGVDRRGMVDELTENGSSESQHRQWHVPGGSKLVLRSAHLPLFVR